jgi:hypothetical protein
MDKEQPVYFSYLLRLWREDATELVDQVDEAPHRKDNRPVWLASLESSLSGQRLGFASLDGLCAFLRQQTGTLSGSESEGAEMEGQ